MSERTAEAATTVDEDGIRVEKSFTDDAFPVPAVMYTLTSHREDPVRVRIVDRIPESFPMDRVGFHPEYESENWTAYKDHRVEFERVIDPDESVETVFGIRDDDPDLDGFLGTPVIEHVPVGEEIEDVLGAGDTDAVREVLSGDRATLPGMAEDDELLPEDPAEESVEPVTTEETDAEPAEATEADDESEAAGEPDVDEAERDDGPTPPEPRAVDEGTAAVTAHEGEPIGAATEAETDAEPEAEPERPEAAAEPADETETAERDASDEAVKLPGEGGLAAALAA